MHREARYTHAKDYFGLALERLRKKASQLGVSEGYVSLVEVELLTEQIIPRLGGLLGRSQHVDALPQRSDLLIYSLSLF